MNETQSILAQVGALSYVGIFGLSFIANVVVPVPEEIIILAIGYVAGTGIINFWITLPVVIAGALLSDIGMYFLSFYGFRAVTWVYDKFFSKIMPLRSEFVEHHVGKIVFLSRFMVNLRFLGPFFAGQTKLSFKKFLAFDFGALLIYVSVLLWAGHYFANRIASIFAGFDQFKNIVLILIGVVILISIGQMMKKFFLGDLVFSFSKTKDLSKYRKAKVPGFWRMKKTSEVKK